MEGISLRNWRIFEKICGEGFTKVVLTTTMWDKVDDQVGSDRERELEDLWRANIERGSSMKRFLCNRPSAADVLSPILEKVTKSSLRLQREITDLNMTLKQTSAARALFLQLEKLLRECQQRLFTVRDEFRNPLLDKNELLRLEEEYKRSSFLLERAMAGSANLKTAPAERLQRYFSMTGLRGSVCLRFSLCTLTEKYGLTFRLLGLGRKPQRAMDGRDEDSEEPTAPQLQQLFFP
jgi:hypothetical protein